MARDINDWMILELYRDCYWPLFCIIYLYTLMNIELVCTATLLADGQASVHSSRPNVVACHWHHACRIIDFVALAVNWTLESIRGACAKWLPLLDCATLALKHKVPRHWFRTDFDMLSARSIHAELFRDERHRWNTTAIIPCNRWYWISQFLDSWRYLQRMQEQTTVRQVGSTPVNSFQPYTPAHSNLSFFSKASSTFIKNGMPWANSDRFGNTSGILGADTVRVSSWIFSCELLCFASRSMRSQS